MVIKYFVVNIVFDKLKLLQRLINRLDWICFFGFFCFVFVFMHSLLFAFWKVEVDTPANSANLHEDVKGSCFNLLHAVLFSGNGAYGRLHVFVPLKYEYKKISLPQKLGKLYKHAMYALVLDSSVEENNEQGLHTSYCRLHLIEYWAWFKYGDFYEIDLNIYWDVRQLLTSTVASWRWMNSLILMN